MSDHDDTKIKFKNEMPREEAAAYFQALVEGVRKGELHLQQAGEQLVLQPQGELKVEIKASRKDSKQRFSFEMSWKAPKKESLITVETDEREAG